MKEIEHVTDLELLEDDVHEGLDFGAGIIAEHVEDGRPDVTDLDFVASPLTQNLSEGTDVEIFVLHGLSCFLQVL